MNAFIFVGPTLSIEEAQPVLGAAYLPPAAEGDLSRAARTGPSVIGIIDGYFHKVPSVWHKEILHAMASGTHVFGSASMGALRAAELHQFGMIGVGRIFEGYASGDITDDDEVAVIHGPPETGYLALSDAMVNIRATLDTAAADGVISPRTCQRLVDIAKATFFPHRRYASLLHEGKREGLPRGELNMLHDWLPAGKIDQKKNDAIAMLQSIDAFLEEKPPKKTVAYFVENTYVIGDEK